MNTSSRNRPCTHKWSDKDALTSVEYLDNHLFAGTVSGRLLVFDLKTYQKVTEVQAHKASVLVLSVRSGILFSGASDSLIKLWDASRLTDKKSVHLKPLQTVFCHCDVGDIFCIEYAESLSTMYFGTQNASIHWVSLDTLTCDLVSTRDASPMSISSESCALHPAIRPNKFFDSPGPGGLFTQQQYQTQELINQGVLHQDATLLEVPKPNSVNFAHNSFVYAMLYTQLAGHSLLVSGGGDAALKVWRIEKNGSLTLIHSLIVSGAVLSMSLSKSWQLSCGLETGEALIVDLETYRLLTYPVAQHKPLLTVSNIGDSLFYASDHTIYEFDLKSKSLSFWQASDCVTGSIPLPGERGLLATTSRDGSLALWDVSHQSQPTLENVQLSDKSSNDAMISTLAQLVAFRTVSSRDGTYWSECRQCAGFLRDLLRGLGAESDFLPVESGNPVVYAKFTANAQQNHKPAGILFYGHYDVIDVGNEWETLPFELTSKDGYLYGRGASDNKGPCVAAIYAVAELYSLGNLPNNVTFLIEGEEESGSFGFRTTIDKHKAKFQPIDWILFSNTYWLDDQRPCLNYGLRGVVSAQIEISNRKLDSHSGVDGGSFREPTQDMINLLSQLTKCPSGEIAIPGFFDNVLPLSFEEETLYEGLLASNVTTSKLDLMHKWRYPSLTIHKLDFSGPDNKTVIPARVVASVSLRIVPNQTVEEVKKLLEDFLKHKFAELDSPNFLTTSFQYHADPWLGDPRNDAFSILKKALTEEWGVEPLFVREGGSIPMARELEKLFGAPAAQLPCGQSSDGAHLKNERLRVTNLIGCRNVLVKLFAQVKRPMD